MKEVSCRFFETPLRELRERGLDGRVLVEGTSYVAADLARKDERVEWSALVRILKNAREVWTRDELVRLGARSVEGPLVQFVAVVARMRFSVLGFYQWVTAPDGVASQMITCVKTTSRSDGPGRLTVDFTMQPGYEPCEEFFLITQGTYAAMPRVLGAPNARVVAAPLPGGIRFHIQYFEPRGVVSALRRAIARPFTLRHAAAELADAHSSLLARYEELDSAREEVERHRELLEIAYQIGQRIWRERDLGAVGAAVTESLIARASVRGARLTTAEEPRVSVMKGDVDGNPSIAVDLPGSPSRGMLEVWAREEADVEPLVDLIVPTIALTLDNAAAYRELSEYKAGLELLVEQRTAELAATVVQLRDAQGARERFFGNISHEIRTPLSLILLSVGEARSRRESSDLEMTHALESIEHSARRLLRMVDELLLLAEGRERDIQLYLVPCELGELVARVVTAWRPAAQAGGFDLGLELPDGLAEPCVVRADPSALERVLANLLSNAMKFTPGGGRIAVRLARDGESARLEVCDTGVGIDPELRGRLFGRFERGRSSLHSVVSGSGIGLSLVKELVLAHGGSIDVGAVEGGGAVFRLLLPLVRGVVRTVAVGEPKLGPQDFGVAVAAVDEREIYEPRGRAQATLLLAEDDAALRDRIATLLSNEYRVVVAKDGLCALRLAELHRPDLLVSDVEMPGLDGIELTRRFRALSGNRVAPVLLLTAHGETRDRLAGFEAGAVDYIVKPFEPAELRARIRSQLALRGLAIQLLNSEKLAALGTLSAGLAHEMRNPANGIVNAIEPLRALLPAELTAPGMPAAALLEVIEHCGDRIASLSSNLLGFRRGAELERRPVALDGLLARVRATSQPSLGRVAVREKFEYTGPLHCAEPLMAQVFANLLDNAAYAAGPGGWVEVHTARDDARVIIEFSDSGSGIPVEHRERVFEPFFTTKPPGSGTGLGLSTAREIVSRHGGSLDVRGASGATVFRVEMPLGAS